LIRQLLNILNMLLHKATITVFFQPIGHVPWARYLARSIAYEGVNLVNAIIGFYMRSTRNRDCILSKIDSETVGAGLAPALYDEASESIVRLTKASRATARVAPTL
jgi:hypothetical protein